MATTLTQKDSSTNLPCEQKLNRQQRRAARKKSKEQEKQRQSKGEGSEPNIEPDCVEATLPLDAEPDWLELETDLTHVKVEQKLDGEGPLMAPDEVGDTQSEVVNSTDTGEVEVLDEAKRPILKKAFYKCLSGSLKGANYVVGTQVYGGPLRSLELASYGGQAQLVSDQMFDLLSENDFLKRQLWKISGLVAFVEKYRDMALLLYMMKASVSEELKERKLMLDTAKSSSKDKPDE